ncbi:MAG: hypothetical protein J2P26_12920, partial [Nocardiopsaceae bacterium]|nr:hypothetical protein [Nocardiopsaceae bacterium]
MNSAGDGDPGRQDPGDEDPGYQDPGDEDPDDEELYNPISYERDPFGSEATRPDATARRTGIWPDESWPPRRPPKRRPPRWIIAATAAVVVAAAAAGTAFALAGGSPTRPAAQSPSAQSPSVPPLPPPVTVAEARAILTRYTAAANAASARLDTAALDGFETGSSRALDAASFATQRAQGSPPGPAVTPARPTFYIPRQGPGYPHWFAVSVANQTVANQTAGGGDSALNTRALNTRALDTQYLLFTQSAPGVPWLD